jgi:predicted  nucleic acid-binding Zn-ribbon protein
MVEDKLSETQDKIDALLLEISECRARKKRWETEAEEIRLTMERLRTRALDEAFKYQGDIAELTDHLNALYDMRDECNAVLRSRQRRETAATIREDNRERM